MHESLESEPTPFSAEMPTGDTQELPVIPELEHDYELIRELGRGGTAVVYLAREKELGRLVAIKLMHPSHLQDEEATARLAREAKTIARLQHPNIVMLYGTRRLGDRGYALILQYVPGTTVKQRLREGGPFSLPLVERVINDLGTALQYAHQHRIVHRDIKPENIFLDEDTGAARLADFGIARFWDSDSGLTLPGTAMGTPNYMSPEQVDGRRDLDGRSDIYSVGLVAWEMATGRQPWAGETLYNVVYKQKHEQLPPLDQLRPDMPVYFRKAIEGALKKNPGERWRDAGELLAALQNPYANILTQSRTNRDEAPPPLAPLPDPPGDDPFGMEDAETIVITRQELERSWGRTPAREGLLRSDADHSTQASPAAPKRNKPEPRTPAATPRPVQEAEPERTARSPSPAAGASASGPAPASTAPGARTPLAAKSLKDRIQPPHPSDPRKPMPTWLAEVEEGRVRNGPWSLDFEQPPKLSLPVIAVVVIVAVVAAIAGVIGFL